jgi:solute:Na+ symporter, SSS family
VVTCETDNSATSNHDVANPPGRLVRIRYATPFMVALDWLMIALYFALLTGLTWWSVARGMLLCAPIAAVFFFGVFMRRLTAAGCLAALIIGFALGLIRLAVDTPVTLGVAGNEHGFTPGSLFWILHNVHFQYYGLLIFLVSVGVLIVVSYLTPPMPDTQLTGLTYATVTAEQRQATRRSWNRVDTFSLRCGAGGDCRGLPLFQRLM